MQQPIPAYAVLVGIDCYDSDQIPNTYGARNDVSHLWRTCVDQLQIRPEHIDVVSAAGISAESLVGGGVDDRAAWLALAERTRVHEGASKDTLLEVLGTLATRVEAGGVGWFHFSGHGFQTLPALALCAQDFDPEKHTGAIDLERLKELFPGGRPNSPADRLTISMDCCWNAAPAPPSPMTELPVTFRLLLGTSPGDVSRVCRIDGTNYGAFSWALSVMLTRWQRTQCQGMNELTVNHVDLMTGVRDLLQTLGVSQVPVLLGPRAADLLPVFHPALGHTVVPTSHRPNQYDPPRQVWAGEDEVWFRLSWVGPQGAELLGYLTVECEQSPGTEYWQLDPDVAWRMLSSVSNGKCGSLVLGSVSEVPAAPPGLVEWALQDEITPSRPPPAQTAEASVLFVFDSPQFKAIYGLSFVHMGEDFVITKTQWWATQIQSNGTLNPVQVADPATFVGQTDPQSVGDLVFSWPVQKVNQLVLAPGS